MTIYDIRDEDMILAFAAEVRRKTMGEMIRICGHVAAGEAKQATRDGAIECMTAIRSRIAAEFAPGHTDLMVAPETLDKFMEDNPLPMENEPPPEYQNMKWHWVETPSGDEVWQWLGVWWPAGSSMSAVPSQLINCRYKSPAETPAINSDVGVALARLFAEMWNSHPEIVQVPAKFVDLVEPRSDPGGTYYVLTDLGNAAMKLAKDSAHERS